MLGRARCGPRGGIRMTRVRLELHQSGGIAAGLRRPVIAVDTTAVQDPARTELEHLARQVQTEPSSVPDNPNARDMMTYLIVIEDGGQEVRLERQDTGMSAACQALVNALRRLGRP